MSTPDVDHLAVAVASIEAAARLWQTLGLQLEGIEEVPSQRVRVGFLPIGDFRLELIEPTADGSPVAKHLQQRGPGLHHLALKVADIEATMQTLQAQGIQLLSDHPQAGADGSLICFVHPRSTHGVLLELVQHGSDHG